MIYFAQKGWKSRIINKLRDWKKSFNNQMAASTIIEAPAVMTAAGLKINRNGQVEYNHTDDSEVKQLRSNLQTIGEAAIAAPTLAGDVEATYQIVRHPVQTAKAVAKAGKEAVNAGKQLVLKEKDVILGFKSRTPRTKKITILQEGEKNNIINNIKVEDILKELSNESPYPNFKTMTREEKIGWLKTQQELALRVDQARNLDALHMTKTRLRDGGFSRLKLGEFEDFLGLSNDVAETIKMNLKHLLFYRNHLRLSEKILHSKPLEGSSKELVEKLKLFGFLNPKIRPESAGGTTGIMYTKMPKDGPLSSIILGKSNKATAHEFAHYVTMPFTRPKGIDLNRLNKYLTGELHNSGAAEIMARFTELKNYFGLKEGESLTPEMWNYARRHFLKDTGYSENTWNATKRLFEVSDTKNKEFPLFLLWGNRHAPVIGAGITTGLTLNSLNNE